MPQATVGVVLSELLARYGFPHGHPFGPERLHAFEKGLDQAGLRERVVPLPAATASRAELELFHDPSYVAFVMEASRRGTGFLDAGDTPVFPGVFEAAATVVGATLGALAAIMAGRVERAFVPVAGLHHAHRGAASGFCVFNDCCLAIQVLRQRWRVERIAYVDIDAHHGDGVFFAFEEDPAVIVADIHEDGRYLFPGTGFAEDTGRGAAAGTKLNLPLAPGSGDGEFQAAWAQVEAHLEAFPPEFVIFQCGADGLAGDPLTHLAYSPACHALATASLCRLAERHCSGRVLALGGGGYHPVNLAAAWGAVVAGLLQRG
ncbi:MAG: acetoin utilization protein AcuC [Thermoanaerobaculaceae bacterium]|nr:acetoin utilization protein AcuC [Thermoanaerobaculaceae bacterium]